LQRQLEASRLFPRPLGPGSEQIRVSCALFNDEEELDRLVATIRAFLG
jgi:selenocysteine lyase/cysteine desulfurase